MRFKAVHLTALVACLLLNGCIFETVYNEIDPEYRDVAKLAEKDCRTAFKSVLDPAGRVGGLETLIGAGSESDRMIFIFSSRVFRDARRWQCQTSMTGEIISLVVKLEDGSISSLTETYSESLSR
ncbi:MAG: hypothetical protein ACSHX3_11680 [Litorimonas sp.]